VFRYNSYREEFSEPVVMPYAPLPLHKDGVLVLDYPQERYPSVERCQGYDKINSLGSARAVEDERSIGV